MPIYEYDCPECGVIEVVQKFSDSPLKSCPNCKEAGRKNKVKRRISAAAFHLKGGGWYKTDYAPGAGPDAGKNGNKKPKAESEASTKVEAKEAVSGETKSKAQASTETSSAK